jgi:uncharacterized protein (TIGR03437 family)
MKTIRIIIYSLVSLLVPAPVFSQTLPAPVILNNGVVPIYSSVPSISQGSWISIFGQNFSTGTATWNGNFPTSLGGVTVSIDSKPAYLWYVSPTQINAQAPNDNTTGTVAVTVTTASGTATANVILAPYAPSFSLLDSMHVAAIVLTPGKPGNSGNGYDIIGPVGAFPYPTRPALPGETVILYGVGFGPTTPAVPAGQAFSRSAPLVTPPILLVNGIQSNVTYSGLVQAGLYQFNVVLPSAGLPPGDVPVLAFAGNGAAATQVTAVLSVQE